MNQPSVVYGYARTQSQVVYNKIAAIELTIHQQSVRFSCQIGFSVTVDATGVTSSILIRRDVNAVDTFLGS